MNTELEKIDEIRRRFRVSYEDAQAALTSASGDLVGALAVVEKDHADRVDLLALGAEMADEVQKLIGGKPIKKLRVKYGNRLVTESPVALKAAAALAVGLAAVFISKLVIEIERGEEEVVV